MRKLTDAELREPNVTLVIPEGKYWSLPKAIYEEIRLFGGKFHKGNAIVSVPAYRYREWANLLPIPKENGDEQPETRE